MTAVVTGPLPIAALAAVVVALLLVDLLVFARGREPGLRESVYWSIGWLVLSFAVAPVIALLADSETAVHYTTVYVVERSLSLDNLFVFLLLFGYFGIAPEQRGPLLFWGIVLALILRGLAILAGSELIERFEVVIYILAATLILLAYRVWRGGTEHTDPEKSFPVRAARKLLPGASTVTVAFVAIAFTDIVFAVDSIPAAFAITDDAFAIWMANAFALLGLRSLFALVEELTKRLRYLDETIAAVLAIVGLELLAKEFVHIGPLASLAIIFVVFAIGISASLLADRREKPSGTAEP